MKTPPAHAKNVTMLYRVAPVHRKIHQTSLENVRLAKGVKLTASPLGETDVSVECL